MKTENQKEVSVQEIIPCLKSAVEAGGKAELTVTGQSMYPFLLHRESRVRLAALTAVRRGDVVLYRRTTGIYVLHRVVRLEKDGSFTMCGDAQFRLEKGILPSQILAKTEAFVRRRGERWQDCNGKRYGLWWRMRLLFRPWRRVKYYLRSALSRFAHRNLKFLFRK